MESICFALSALNKKRKSAPDLVGGADDVNKFWQVHPSSNTACAAAKRAIGTRKGEQET